MAKRSNKSLKLAAKIIKKWEGFMPEPYLCPGGVPTIGYGSTRYGITETRSRLKIAKLTKRGEEILLYLYQGGS
jgi:lysozyme